jgi:hypothetical protein
MLIRRPAMSNTERDLREALELALIFHASRRTRMYRDRWEEIAGTDQITVAVLCAHIGGVLARKEP